MDIYYFTIFSYYTNPGCSADEDAESCPRGQDEGTTEGDERASSQTPGGASQGKRSQNAETEGGEEEDLQGHRSEREKDGEKERGHVMDRKSEYRSSVGRKMEIG